MMMDDKILYTKIDDRKYAKSILQMYIDEWLRENRMYPLYDKAKNERLKNRFLTIAIFIDTNRYLFRERKDLLPRRYFRKKSNVCARKYTYIHSIETYFLFLGDFFQEKKHYGDVERVEDLKNIRRNLDG